MIKILDHTKPLTQLVNDTTNGLGKIEPLECLVTEELNGIYEAQILILQTDKHFNDIALNGLLEINAGEVIGNQIFRIYFISKPIDGKIVIKCQHISYDLAKVAVEPFSATGAVNTKNGLLSHIVGTYPFDMMTDILNNTSYFSLDIPKSFRECLGGWEGSVLDTFRCEYEWDNLLVKMLAHRGTDEGVRIAYGKNLTDFKQEENIQNVYTSVLGYAVVNEQTYVGEVYHKIVSNLPKVKIVDFSNDFGDTAPTTAQLTQKAQEYATNNSIEVPNVSIDIKFVPLYQTEEYKNIAPLERVGLGDTVHVFFEKMGVEATSRVVKTVWNALLNKYESVELGDTRANLTTLLDDAVQEAKENITIDAGYIETELNDMSQLIINGLGLHRTLVPVATGGHRMYLHNKPTLAESDTQYMIGAGGFMISTDYGQTWNSGWDADGNVVVNSLATITLKALEIYGSYLCFGDYPNGKYIEASTYSDSSSVQQGVSFDGSGYIRMRPQESFIVDNIDSNENILNEIILSKSGTRSQPFLALRNNDPVNFLRANFIQLDARYSNSSTPTDLYNRIQITNYGTLSGTGYLANAIGLTAYENRNIARFTNYRLNSSSKYASRLEFTSNGTDHLAELINYMYDSTSSIANRLQFRTNVNTHSVEITNRDFSGMTGNVLEMDVESSGRRYFQLFNYDVNRYNPGTGTRISQANRIYMSSDGTTNTTLLANNITTSNDNIIANQLEMKANSNLNTFRIDNYKASSSSKANTIYMEGVPLNGSGINEMIFRNYDVDGDNYSDEIYMGKSSTNNQIIMTLYRGNNAVASFSLERDSSVVKIRMRILSNTSYNYKYANLELRSDGNIYANGTNFYWNGSQKW